MLAKLGIATAESKPKAVHLTFTMPGVLLYRPVSPPPLPGEEPYSKLFTFVYIEHFFWSLKFE